jgi:hypothetical protein
MAVVVEAAAARTHGSSSGGRMQLMQLTAGLVVASLTTVEV